MSPIDQERPWTDGGPYEEHDLRRRDASPEATRSPEEHIIGREWDPPTSGGSNPLVADTAQEWGRPTSAQRAAARAADPLGMIAHEIRSCVSPIDLQLALVRSGRLGMLTPQQDRAINIAERSLGRLAILLQDVADLSRIQADAMRLDRKDTDLNHLVHEIADAFGDVAEKAGVDVHRETEGALRIYADPDRLMQVITNLVTNAIKFTPAGGAVTITTRRSEDRMEMTVRDTGRGMASYQMERLFQPFAQVHGPDTALQGNGLGLYITKGIIREHGGEISVSSPGPGFGSTFTVRIPLHHQDDHGFLPQSEPHQRWEEPDATAQVWT